MKGSWEDAKNSFFLRYKSEGMNQTWKVCKRIPNTPDHDLERAPRGQALPFLPKISPILDIRLSLRLLLISSSNKPPHNKVLLTEALLPPLERLQLIPGKVRQSIKWAIQILGQHILVEAALRQTSRGIATRKVGVWPTGSVEVTAAGYVEDTPSHGKVDGGVVLAVEREQGSWGECLEDDSGFFFREGNRCLGLDECVDCVSEDAEQEDVEGGEDAVVGGSSLGCLLRYSLLDVVHLECVLLDLYGLAGG